MFSITRKRESLFTKAFLTVFFLFEPINAWVAEFRGSLKEPNLIQGRNYIPTAGTPAVRKVQLKCIHLESSPISKKFKSSKRHERGGIMYRTKSCHIRNSPRGSVFRTQNSIFGDQACPYWVKLVISHGYRLSERFIWEPVLSCNSSIYCSNKGFMGKAANLVLIQLTRVI